MQLHGNTPAAILVALYQFKVRGRAKTKSQTLWHALAFNFMRMRNLVCPLCKMSYLEVVMVS